MRWELRKMSKLKSKDLFELTVVIVIYLVAYKFSNFYHFTNPTEVPFSSIDQFWSFNPHWIWIYLSSYFAVPIFYLLYFKDHAKKSFIISFLFLSLGSCTFFFFFPTFIPRENFLPADLNPVYKIIFELLHQADEKTNCLPSLHVSTAFLCAWFILKTKRKYFIPFLIYAVLVSISTMTVKQHYFYDVLFGFLASVLSIWPIWIYRKDSISSQTA